MQISGRYRRPHPHDIVSVCKYVQVIQCCVLPDTMRRGLMSLLMKASELFVSPVRKLVRLADLVAVDEHALLFAK